MNLEFLKDVKVEAIKKSAPKTKTSVPSIPTEADLRVFPNGKVYPSEDFAAKMNLEFQVRKNVAPEGVEPQLEVVGNGLDIFPSTEWGMIKEEMEQNLLFACAVPKALAKVDMWSSTKYEEDGSPKASVFTQGSNTFAKNRLVPMIENTYGINWDTTLYVDLVFNEEYPIVSPTGIYHLPKIVSTGKNKGEATYIRRENLTICPLTVAHVEAKEPKEDPKPDVIANKTPEPVFEEQKDVTDNSPELQETTGNVPGEDWADKLGQSTN